MQIVGKLDREERHDFSLLSLNHCPINSHKKKIIDQKKNACWWGVHISSKSMCLKKKKYKNVKHVDCTCVGECGLQPGQIS